MTDGETPLLLIDAGSSGRGWSWRELLLRCPQKFAYQNLMGGYAREPRDPLIKGSLVHQGLAHANVALMCEQNEWVNRHLPWRDAVEAEATKNDCAIGHGDHWGRWVSLAHESVAAYLDQRQAPRMICVERKIEMWIDERGQVVGAPSDAAERLKLATDAKLALWGPPYLHTARIDWMEQDDYGRFWVIDAKSCYKIDQTKRDGFALSGQVLGLTKWATEAYGDKFGGFALQMIMLRSGRDRFPRIIPTPAPWALRQWGMSVVESEERLARLLKTQPDFNLWPRTFSEQGPCMDRYGPCDFRQRCMTGR